MINKVREDEEFKVKLLFVMGTIFMLILVIGATYAYFDMTGVFDETKTSVKGKTLADSTNAPTLISKTTALKMNITNTNMAYPNVGKKFYATPSGTLVPESEVAIDNGRYILSTASVNEEELTYDCNVKFKISAEVTNELSSASSDNVVVVFTDNLGTATSYTLTEILSEERIVLGSIYGLDSEKSQNYYVEAYVLNTEENQGDLIDNPFTINILPVKSSDGFQCESYNLNSGKVVASINENVMTVTITNGKFDSDKYCVNNSADTTDCTWENVTSLNFTKTLTTYGTYYVHVIDKVGNIIHSNSVKYEVAFANKLIESGALWQSGLEGDGYRYTGSGAYNSETTPNNFICFGTTDKTTCKGNEAKYLYRIIGVFPDSSNNQHVKLISFKQLISTTWDSSNSNVDWGSSTLFTSLNGSGFLTNSTYDYLQNSTWLNKIENWQWTAVNTKTFESSGPNYYSGVNTQQMYLHEMNRSGKTSSVGVWTTPSAKIGLMYASDYQMSLGSSSLSYTGSSNASTLKTGWMHQSNNDTTKSTYEWTLSRDGDDYGCDYYAWYVNSSGYVNYAFVDSSYGVRPVFYLTSNVAYKSGTGTYADPYIIAE